MIQYKDANIHSDYLALSMGRTQMQCHPSNIQYTDFLPPKIEVPWRNVKSLSGTRKEKDEFGTSCGRK